MKITRTQFGIGTLLVSVGFMLGYAAQNQDQEKDITQAKDYVIPSAFVCSYRPNPSHTPGFNLEKLMAKPACLSPEQMGAVGLPFTLEIDEEGEGFLKYAGPDMW